MSMHIRQPPVDTVMTDGQPCVVDSQQVQNRGMDVVGLRRIVTVQRLIAPLIKRPIRHVPINVTTIGNTENLVGASISYTWGWGLRCWTSIVTEGDAGTKPSTLHAAAVQFIINQYSTQ